MLDYKVNAKVIENFNDKTKLDENGEPYLREKNEIIKDMDRARFEELQSKGYVIEDKSFKDKKNNKESEWE